jgi:hypothetical protein
MKDHEEDFLAFDHLLLIMGQSSVDEGKLMAYS